jgi:beta-lactamase superfamily II metal-dependent hydrolase
MNRAPSADEPEVFLLGPGFGESVVLHLGGSAWVVVDSCLDSRTGGVASIEYLEHIGVDPSTAVKQVVATHWHDDHVRGLADTVDACRSAELVCTDALREGEFRTLVLACGKRSMMETSGVSEFYRVLKILEGRAAARHGQAVKFAVADRSLLRGSYSISSGAETTYELRALSPSDRAIVLSHLNIASLLPRAETPKRRVSAIQPNHTAVALLARSGDQFVLLGADLEEEGNPGGGWTAVLASTGREPTKAGIYKVPHHGSANSDHPGVWAEMLTPRPHAILSPFFLGDIVLPTQKTRKEYRVTPTAHISPRRLARRPPNGDHGQSRENCGIS